jgi:uncharacterized protein
MPAFPIAAPLSDAEIGELDDLLAAIPEPLQALDVVMLDGYLCGVIAQPVLIDAGDWLPPAFDWNLGDPEQPAAGQVLTADTPGWHAAKHERLLALVMRHHEVLERQLREDAWFDPLVMQPEGDDGRPLEGTAAIAPALAPWAVGFEHALNQFAALETLNADELPDLLACLRRHLPEQEGDDRAYTRALDAEHPLRSLDEAIEDLVGNVVAVCDLARGERLKVETVRRAGPKLGRNDPCHCGSGKKFKQCHGRSEG